MKRALILLLSVMLCACFLASCSKGDVGIGDIELKPTKAVNAEDLISAEKFIGSFSNKEYKMTVQNAEKGLVHVTIKSKIKKNVSYEWEIEAFFSEQTYRINYTDAIKTVVKYDKNGNETNREEMYNNGVGRIQFSDSDNLTWQNSVDNIKTNQFTRQ